MAAQRHIIKDAVVAAPTAVLPGTSCPPGYRLIGDIPQLARCPRCGRGAWAYRLYGGIALSLACAALVRPRGVLARGVAVETEPCGYKRNLSLGLHGALNGSKPVPPNARKYEALALLSEEWAMGVNVSRDVALLGALKRCVKTGLVEVALGPGFPSGKQNYYRLTKLGVWWKSEYERRFLS